MDVYLIENKKTYRENIKIHLKKVMNNVDLNIIEFNDLKQCNKKFNKHKTPKLIITDLFGNKEELIKPTCKSIYNTIMNISIPELIKLRKKIGDNFKLMIISKYHSYLNDDCFEDGKQWADEIKSILDSKIKPNWVIDKIELIDKYEEIKDALESFREII